VLDFVLDFVIGFVFESGFDFVVQYCWTRGYARDLSVLTLSKLRAL